MTNTRFIGVEERVRFCSDSIDNFHDWLGIVVQDELVGFVEYEDDGDHELFLHLIEVNARHRNKGFSKILLDELKRLNPYTMAFTGESTPKAVPYWTENGAQFEPSTFNEFDEASDMEGVVFPFALSLASEYRPYWTK